MLILIHTVKNFNNYKKYTFFNKVIHMGNKISILFISLFFASSVYGASLTTSEVFQEQVRSKVSERMGVVKSKPKNSSVRFFKLNLDLLFGSEPFDIELIPGSTLSFEKEAITLRSENSYSWRGKIAGNIKSRANFAVEGSDLSGNITIENMRYEIRPMGDGVHSVSEIDSSALLNEKPPLVPVPALNLVPKEPQSFKDDGSTIDVMIAYTQDVANDSSNILTEIQLFVDDTNQYFENSGITQRISLVKTLLVYYAESYAASTDLNRLRKTSDDYLDEVHSVRDSYGADIVTLLVKRMDDACGIGYLLEQDNQSYFDQLAFNVVDIDCGSLTYAHELGHNMGAHHDTGETTDPGWDSYSHGYRDNTNNFRTIMAYGTETRIGYFSDDAELYGGKATGSAADEDNVRTLDETRTVVANFRTSVSNEPYGDDTDLWDVCFIGLIDDQNELHIFLMIVLLLVIPFIIYVFPTILRLLKVIPFLVLLLIFFSDNTYAQVATPSFDYLEYSEMPASSGYRDKNFLTGALSYGTGSQVSDVSSGGEDDVTMLKGVGLLNYKMPSYNIELYIEPQTRKQLTINGTDVLYLESEFRANAAYIVTSGLSAGLKGWYRQSESDETSSIVVNTFSVGGGISKTLNDAITVAGGLSYVGENETDAKDLAYIEIVAGAGYQFKTPKPMRFEYSLTYSPKAVNNGSGTTNTNMKPKTYTHRIALDAINQNFITTLNVKFITEEALNSSYEDKTTLSSKFALSKIMPQYNNMRMGGFLTYKQEVYGTSDAVSFEFGFVITKMF
jgi:hypothetical protein